jgi:hypothetical protein
VTHLRRAIAAASFLVGAVLMCWAIHLDNSYAATMPREPDSARGRVIPMIVHHGSHIVVNEAEIRTWDKVRLYNVFGVSFAALGLGIAGADHLWSRRKRPSTRAP